MGLPNYIVNLEEFVNSIADGYKSMKLLGNGTQRSKGLKLENMTLNEIETSWIAPHDLLITGVRFGIDECRNIGYTSNWDMYINNILTMSSIYIKEMNEYKRFRNFYPVLKGQEIKFIFHNETKIDKDVFFDIDYIQSEIPSMELIVTCIDKITGDILTKYNSFYTPPITTKITAPNIGGFSPVGDEEILVTFDINTQSPVEITFYYEPDEKEVIIICLNQDGFILQEESFAVYPPYRDRYYAPIIEGYKNVGKSYQDIEITADSSSPIRIFFNYKIESKRVEIVYMDRDTGTIIESTVKIYNPPAHDTIIAPVIAGYEIDDNNSRDIFISEDSPSNQKIVFFYKKIRDETPPIEHDYDYKIIMRWQSKVSTDMDLHVFFDKNEEKHLYYKVRSIEIDNNNKAWYDYDFTYHFEDNDYEAKPEIVTILGKPYDTVQVKVYAFSGVRELTQDVVIQIYKINSAGNDILERELRVPYRTLINDGIAYYVCDINLQTGEIREVGKSLSHINKF